MNSRTGTELKVGIYPAPENVTIAGKAVHSKPDGVFQRFAPIAARGIAIKTTCECLQAAGPAKEIPLGRIRQPVAAGPEDKDFEKAGVWRVGLPSDIDLSTDPILRLNYVGDVARITLNGKLITDDFYNGNAFEIGLRRYAAELLNGDLRVAILPLRRDARIYMAEESRPDFRNAASMVTLRSVEVIPRNNVELRSSITTKAQPESRAGENAEAR